MCARLQGAGLEPNDLALILDVCLELGWEPARLVD